MQDDVDWSQVAGFGGAVDVDHGALGDVGLFGGVPPPQRFAFDDVRHFSPALDDNKAEGVIALLQATFWYAIHTVRADGLGVDVGL